MDELKDVESAASAAGGSLNSMGVAGGRNGSGANNGLQYSIPGILHFLQHEWSRFEMERGQWEVERAELNARIAFLQGERKGQENLKNDLVRRIKMLEYALKQERAKYAKLKYGNDASNTSETSKPPLEEDGVELPPLDGENYIAVSNVNWRQGRQLLRQYLHEIGYTDTIIDVRSNRVRSLLGLHDVPGDLKDMVDGNIRSGNALNGGDGALNSTSRRTGTGNVPDNSNNQVGNQTGSQPANRGGSGGQGGRGVATTLAEEMMIDTEAAVMANFDFLSSEVEVDDDEEMGEDGDDGYTPDIKLKGTSDVLDQVDKDTEEVLDFSYVPGSMEPGGGGGSGNQDPDSVDGVKGLGTSGGQMVQFAGAGGKNQPQQPQQARPGSAGSNSSGGDEDLTGNLELGELGQLTITNDNESAYDQISTPKEAFRKTWSAKYTLRSHFDGVRALGFHPTEPVLITASEDQTLKLWNLQKTVPAKKSAALDVEPVYTFRAHTGPVLSLAIASSGDLCFSGGIDSTIRVWNMPNPSVDPYDCFDPSVLAATLRGHTDAVWSLAYNTSRQQLLSASSDGTVKLWSPVNKTQSLLRSFEREAAMPTSVDWVKDDQSHMVAAYTNADCVIYDIETGNPVIKLDTMSDGADVGLITKVVSHPTLPLTITAHEDRHIRFFDNSTGKQTHVMVAHLDAVTSLAVDTNGLYLISGSHDSSVRLWNLETKTCIQEITAHRKKFDESIFDVAFHPSRPYIASAGADALAKVFV